MSISVRRAERADAGTIASFNSDMAVETEGIELSPGVAIAGAEAVFDDPSLGFYLVAECDGVVVGSLMITYEWSDWSNANYWWIQSVYVAPAHRRRGVYRSLHDAAVAMARETGNVRALKLYVFEENHRAMATYEALGMERAHHAIYEIAVRPGETARG